MTSKTKSFPPSQEGTSKHGNLSSERLNVETNEKKKVPLKPYKANVNTSEPSRRRNLLQVHLHTHRSSRMKLFVANSRFSRTESRRKGKAWPQKLADDTRAWRYGVSCRAKLQAMLHGTAPETRRNAKLGREKAPKLRKPPNVEQLSPAVSLICPFPLQIQAAQNRRLSQPAAIISGGKKNKKNMAGLLQHPCLDGEK